MRLLVIEDNPKVAGAIRKGLGEHGFAVDVVHEGFEGEDRAANGGYDVILLDLMLPDRDGIEICRNLRRRGVSTPILMLTALSTTANTVEGLDAGADDYLTKPFEFVELVARVRALLRRGTATESRVLRAADLVLDLNTRVADRAGRSIPLTNREFTLLEYFMRHPAAIISRVQLAERVWNTRFEPGSNVIEVYVSQLRRKIDQAGFSPLIETVKGAGYRFNATPTASEPPIERSGEAPSR